MYKFLFALYLHLKSIFYDNFTEDAHFPKSFVESMSIFIGLSAERVTETVAFCPTNFGYGSLNWHRPLSQRTLYRNLCILRHSQTFRAMKEDLHSRRNCSKNCVKISLFQENTDVHRGNFKNDKALLI